MPALIDLWLMPARLWLDLVAPPKLAPLATDVVPLAKARCIRRKRKGAKVEARRLTRPSKPVCLVVAG
jgi:hypothetical protein